MNFLFFFPTTRAKNFPNFRPPKFRSRFNWPRFAAERALAAQQCARTRVFERPGWTHRPRVYLRSAASAFFRRGLRPFSPSPLFFFPSIPARSVCRSSALIASKNVGRARVPRNVPMIFRPPNSHLSLTGHATNKISPAPPREIADAENTVSSRFCSPPPLILQEQDGEVRVIERFN